jgi:hypothetical protein
MRGAFGGSGQPDLDASGHLGQCLADSDAFKTCGDGNAHACRAERDTVTHAAANCHAISYR